MKKHIRIIYSVLLIVSIVCMFLPIATFHDNTIASLNADIVKEEGSVTRAADKLVRENDKVKGLTIEAISYKNGEPGDDIYVTVKQGENTFEFCVERYLTGPETEVYAAVGALVPGDVVDVTGFVYWYNGVNTHITAVAKAEKFTAVPGLPGAFRRRPF